jgi:hypothetical protein
MKGRFGGTFRCQARNQSESSALYSLQTSTKNLPGNKGQLARKADNPAAFESIV